MHRATGRGLFTLLMAWATALGCDGERGEGTPAAEHASWVSPIVAIVFFDRATGQAVPERWDAIDAAFRAEPGFRRNLLFGAQQSEHPYVNFAVWERATNLAAAMEKPELRALLPDAAVGTYERAVHRGDIREPGAAITIVPITRPDENMEEKFRLAGEWFGQRDGFVGAMLLRRVGGDTAPYVLIARWTSADAFRGVTADQDFPLHTSGAEGVLGTYVPVNP
ncbi:MAG: hypothetical protein AAGH15_03615 [Myxococcota bacterium]